MATKQKFQFGPTVPVEAYTEITSTPERHWHGHIEINYVLTGTLTIRVKDQTYHLEEDQLILINPYDIHEIISQGCELVVFNIDLSRFDHTLVDDSLRFDCNSSTSENKDIFTPIKTLLARFIHSYANSNSESPLLNKSLSYAILHCLMQNFKVEEVSGVSENQSQMNRMDEIMKYINHHYHEPLTLNDLAEKFFLSVPYLSKIFKQYIGSTFTDYMNSIRLSHAILEIGKTDISIEFLGEKNGFPNTRSFVSAFKNQYGMIPSKYRKEYIENRKNQKKPPAFTMAFSPQNNLHKLAKYIKTESPISTKSSIRPGNSIEVPPVSAIQKGFGLKHNFLNLTSISKAKHILFAENQAVIKMLQSEIGFRYIKFHGLLDDDMMVYSETKTGTPELNFSYINNIIDFLLSVNLRPFIELSFMPSELAEDRDRTTFYTKSIISFPKNMNHWTYLIHELVNHLLNRYGKKEVESWPFTLWNVPDSPEFMFGFDDRFRFFDFYKNTYNTIKKCNPSIPVGSPSCMNETYEIGDWINDFLDYSRKNDCIPDFLNFHFYPIDIRTFRIGTYAQTYANIIYRKSPNALKETLEKISENRKKFEWNIPKTYLSEWNSSISHRDLLSDTAFKSSYLVKNILENYDQLDSFCYWVLTDFNEEVKLSDHLFHGGLGLCTANGIKKSSYYAFCLLSKLGDRLLSKGEGYFITKSGENYQAIVYNYQHFSNIYASGELFDMTFTNRYTPFPDTTRLKIVIPFSDLPNTEYVIKETILNKKNGSAFDKWIDLGALPLETEEEVQYLKSISIPAIKKRRLSVENNLLYITCELDPHEVRLIEIQTLYKK